MSFHSAQDGAMGDNAAGSLLDRVTTRLEAKQPTPILSPEQELDPSRHRTEVIGMIYPTFSTEEFRTVRKSIEAAGYWKVETLAVLEALALRMQRRRRAEDGNPTPWQVIAEKCWDLLLQDGVSSDQAENVRRSIADTEYWDTEMRYLDDALPGIREQRRQKYLESRRKSPAAESAPVGCGASSAHVPTTKRQLRPRKQPPGPTQQPAPKRGVVASGRVAKRTKAPAPTNQRQSRRR
ncbi:hypothetical protein B0T19DRAFT_74772 [Cercophora scortea]|uniref:Uncharacterized protein n=1 Tax=Cercophora scortea TaxID=314031 RepID=A0AAE0J5T1_9PEZI|nr:hypothetical protein B0T19DRAFT_74772 [Cercophora scortea]